MYPHECLPSVDINVVVLLFYASHLTGIIEEEEEERGVYVREVRWVGTRVSFFIRGG